MYKLFGILKRPEGVSLAEFHRWWLEEHVTLVKRFPSLKQYTINHRTTEDSPTLAPTVCRGARPCAPTQAGFPASWPSLPHW